MMHNGLLILDKPPGMTSRDAVNRAQRWFPRRTRIGHTGTLDPLATGVLVLCVGSATRLAEYVQDLPKLYRAGILLGARSDTDDAEGIVTPVAGAVAPDRPTVDSALQSFVGVIDQVPPVYSATRVARRHAYDLARRGKAVELAPRPIRIDRIDILDYRYPQLTVDVACGKGTYIRSLARDLGDKLGCGGLIQSLRRLAVGPFTPDQAVPQGAPKLDAQASLLPIERAVTGLPRLTLESALLEKLRHGQSIPWNDSHRGTVALFAPDDTLSAIARLEAGILAPEKIL